jgi:acyl-CoA thioester hydrolase
MDEPVSSDFLTVTEIFHIPYVRYVRPLLLNQEIKVTASLKEWELRLVVDYKVLDDKGRTCTKARTVQVPVDAETLKLQFGSPEILVKNVRERLLVSMTGK